MRAESGNGELMSQQRASSIGLHDLPLSGELRPWWVTLKSNALLPALIALMWPLGWLVQPSESNAYLARIVMLIGINIILAVSLQLINGIGGQFSLGHAGFMAVGAYMSAYPAAAFMPDFTSDATTANPLVMVVFYLALLLTLTLSAAIIVGLILLARLSRRAHRFLPGLLIVILFLWFIADVKIAYESEAMGGYLVWSQTILGLQRLFQSLLGHGQQWAQSLLPWIPLGCRIPLTFLLALIGGGSIAALAGLLVGLPTLRLKGDYLAIATLGFAEIIRVAVTNSAALGKATGLSLPVYSFLPEPGEAGPAQRIFPWIYSAMLITIVAVWRIAHSAKGRALQAVREDEVAAAATGIDTTSHKVLAFVIGAFFAGVAGGLFAYLDGYLNPNTFGFMKSVEIVVMVTLGGLGSISGAIVAAIVLTWLPEFLRSPADWIALPLRPFGVQSTESLHLPQWLLGGFKAIAEKRMVIYSLLLVAMMLLRPRGLLGGREWWFRRRQATPPLTTEGEAP